MTAQIKDRKIHIAISVLEELYEKLNILKLAPREPMYDVIQRLYDFHDKHKNCKKK